MRVELGDIVLALPPVPAEPQPACGFTADDYAQVLADLLPRGWAWPRDPVSVLMRVFAGLAVEFARVHARDCDLLAEAYPGTATEALSDWERITGLPDDCLPAFHSIQARRAAVLFKLGARGGASRGYFIWVAKLLGFDITITEFQLFRCGQGRCGDRVFREGWAHTWLVNAPAVTVQYFCAGQSACGERLAQWGNAVLECVLNRLKPAHTILLFGYGGQPPRLGDWDDQQSIWDVDLPGGPSWWDQP